MQKQIILPLSVSATIGQFSNLVFDFNLEVKQIPYWVNLIFLIHAVSYGTLFFCLDL